MSYLLNSYRNIRGWMDAAKRDIAWLVAGQFGRGLVYTAADIERLVGEIINETFLCDPSLAPDHIRVAMVEAGYLTRDARGSEYRVCENFIGPLEEGERERTLLQLAGELSQGGNVVSCPACGDRLGATSLLGHCQQRHAWSARWASLVEKYCR